VVGIAAACVFTVAAVIASLGGKKDDAPSGGGDGGGSKPTAGAGGGKPAVLFVVPSEGVFGPDYFPVKQRLERDNKVKVVTASGKGEPATLQFEKWKTVPVERKLADVDPSEFAAAIFCGFNTDEYVPPDPTGRVAKSLIEKMNQQKKVLASICLGNRILIQHGAVRGKEVAVCSELDQRFKGIAHDPNITRVNKGVVEAGNVITAGNPTKENAAAFAEAILKALKAD